MVFICAKNVTAAVPTQYYKELSRTPFFNSTGDGIVKRIQKFIAGTAALSALLTGAALAADLPTKAPLLSPVPVYKWSGFYVGGQVGTGWGTSQTNVDVGNTFIGAPVNQTVNQLIAGSLGLTVPLPQVQMNGFVGGAQAGYNYQTGMMVFGVEGDILGAGLKGTTVCILVLNCTNKIDWIADITGRVGVTVGDRALVYVKGGAAWAGASVGINQSVSVASTLLGGIGGEWLHRRLR